MLITYNIILLGVRVCYCTSRESTVIGIDLAESFPVNHYLSAHLKEGRLENALNANGETRGIAGTWSQACIA